MKHRHTGTEVPHRPLDTAGDLDPAPGPGRKPKVPPLQFRIRNQSGKRLAPLPEQLRMVAERGQRTTQVAHVHNPHDEPVEVAGAILPDRSFEAKVKAQTVEPHSVMIVPVTFAPERGPEDHATSHESSLELLGADAEQVAHVRLRGSARPTSDSTRRFVEGQEAQHREQRVLTEARAGYVSLPATVAEIEAYVQAAVQIESTDRDQAIALVHVVNEKLLSIASPDKVYERFAHYGAARTTAMMSVGAACDQMRILESHLRSGASINGRWFATVLGSAREALQVLNGERKDATTLRAFQYASPFTRAADAIIDTAHDILTDGHYALGFGVGVIRGVYESIADLIGAILPTAKLAFELVKTMISSGIPGVVMLIAKKLIHFFGEMPGALRAMGEHFAKEWDAEDPYQRGHFRGEALGYVVAQIALTLLTCGAAAAAQAGSKWAALARLVERLSAAGDITQWILKATELTRVLDEGNLLRGPWPRLRHGVEAVQDASKEDALAARRAEREATERHEKLATLKEIKATIKAEASNAKPEQLREDALLAATRDLSPEEIALIEQDIIPLDSYRRPPPEPPEPPPVQTGIPTAGQDEQSHLLNAQSQRAGGPAPTLYSVQNDVIVVGHPILENGAGVGPYRQAAQLGHSVDALPGSLVVVVKGPYVPQMGVPGGLHMPSQQAFEVRVPRQGGLQGHFLKPRGLAQYIKKTVPDLHKYERVILVSEYAGSSEHGIAKQTAQHLRKPVYAPNEYFTAHATGPKVGRGGGWRRFDAPGPGANMWPGAELYPYTSPDVPELVARSTAVRPEWPGSVDRLRWIDARKNGLPAEEAFRIAKVKPKLETPKAPIQEKHTHDGTGGDPHELAAMGTSGTAGTLPFLGQIQASFGRHDVSKIQAHTDEAAINACHGLGAMAFATGNRVAFGGTPDLHTAAHEAAHVVQQRSGVYLKDGLGDTGDLYEKHADRAADAVVAGKSAEPVLDELAGHAGPAEHAVVDGALDAAYSASEWFMDGMWLAPFDQPMQRKLVTHYLRGTGEGICLTKAEMAAIQPVVDIRRSDAFMAQVERLKAAGGGTESVVASGSAVALMSATLGDFTIHWNGQVEVMPEGMWRFTGVLFFFDYWNFDKKGFNFHKETPKDSGRPPVAELKVRTAGFAMPGKPYDITSEFVAVTQHDGEQFASWPGKPHRVGDRISQTESDAGSDGAVGAYAGDSVAGPPGACVWGDTGVESSLHLTEDTNHRPVPDRVCYPDDPERACEAPPSPPNMSDLDRRVAKEVLP